MHFGEARAQYDVARFCFARLISQDLFVTVLRQCVGNTQPNGWRWEGTSKAALIQRFLEERLRPLPPLESDHLWGIVGAYDGEPGDVDEVVYG